MKNVKLMGFQIVRIDILNGYCNEHQSKMRHLHLNLACEHLRSRAPFIADTDVR